MLWIKALHVVFMVTWFAGLFYIPRLFIYHVESDNPAVRAQLQIMQGRLLAITHFGALLTIVFGFWTLSFTPAFLHQPWLHMKLPLVGVLVIYHGVLMRFHRQLAQERFTRSSRWLRLFNEVPAFLLIAIVLLAVVKPM